MRDFLKYTFASLLALLIFLGLSIGGILFLVILAAFRDPGPQVKDKSILTFDLAVDITDAQQSSRRSLEEAVTGGGTETISLREVLDAINQAAKDKRIVGVYLHGDMSSDGIGSGLATLKEVREALQRFQAAGKKIIAYDVDWREREYYLGSVADTIAINPVGVMEVNGLSSEGTFFAGALQKFGVGVQVTRVGKYKSAVEPFLLTRRSSENQQQTQTLLNDLWNETLATVSKDRKLTPQQIQGIANSQGFLESDDALKRGFVTKRIYEDEVIDQLKQLTGQGNKDKDDKSFRQISLKSYTKLAETELRKGSFNKKIAVVYAEGAIVDGEGNPGDVGAIALPNNCVSFVKMRM